MPNNAIAWAIVEFAESINTVGMLVSISLTPMALAGFLMRPSMRRIAWAVSAVLFLFVCISIVLFLNPPLMSNRFSATPSLLVSVLLAILRIGMGLFPVIVPLCGAIWISVTIGTSVLAKVVTFLSSVVAVLLALSVLDTGVPYSDHYAFALYTFVYLVTFRRAPSRTQLWGGFLMAIWLLPLAFVLVPGLAQASLINHVPTRLDAYVLVFSQVPPPPQYGVPILPVLLGAMFVFSDAAPRHAAYRLAVFLGAVIFCYAIISTFNIFGSSPAHAFASLRSGIFTLGEVILSSFFWLMLFAGSIALTGLSVLIYKTATTKPV